MKKALFLDFDGVICDSIEECYCISKEAYFGFAKFELDEKPYKKLFWRYRGLVRPPFQYLFLHKAIVQFLKNEIEDIQFCFQELSAKVDQSEKHRFEYAFFKMREYYQEDVEKWVKLNPLTRYGKTLQHRELRNYFIVTTKDIGSIGILLNHYDINIQKIYDREAFIKFGSKGKIISYFLDHSDFTEAIFVDDAKEHLDSAKDTRINCLFADWGYGENSSYEKFQY